MSSEVSLIDKSKEYIKLIEEKTGVNGIFVILCLILSIICVYLNIFDNLITNLVGTVYPAFWTMKSIETKGDDDKQWLTYWVVFASFTIVDLFSGFIVKFVPFYFVFKIIFLIWLFMPNSNGAYYVYHLMLVRVFKTIENDIDNAADKLKGYTNDFVLNGSKVDTFTSIKKAVEVTAQINNIAQPSKSNETNNKADAGNMNKIDEDNSDDSILQYDSNQEQDDDDENNDSIKKNKDNDNDGNEIRKQERKLNSKSFQNQQSSPKKGQKESREEEANIQKIKKIKSEIKDQKRNEKSKKMKLEKKQTYATLRNKLDTSTTDNEKKLNTSAFVSSKNPIKKDK